MCVQNTAAAEGDSATAAGETKDKPRRGRKEKRVPANADKLDSEMESYWGGKGADGDDGDGGHGVGENGAVLPSESAGEEGGGVEEGAIEAAK